MDNGSGSINCGLSSSDSMGWSPDQGGEGREPTKNCVGIPLFDKLKGLDQTTHEGDYYVGEEMQDERGLMALKWTMNRGAVQDWDAMKHLWNHVVENQFRIEVENDILGMVLTEPCLNSRENRELVAKYWFEEQNSKRVYFGLQAVLTLVGSGYNTGTIINSGGGVTEVVPVFNNYPLRHAYQRIAWGGIDSTEWLQRELHKSGVALETSADTLIVQELKEKIGRVSMDYEADCDKLMEEPEVYELPDSSTIKVRGEILTCGEMLFRPMICGKDLPGVHQLVKKSIDACPMDVRSKLMGSIVCAGGTTMFPNYENRLTRELETLYKDQANAKLKVIAPPERLIISLQGANILTGLSTFQGSGDGPKMWVSKQEWDEVGPHCVHRMSQS